MDGPIATSDWRVDRVTLRTVDDVEGLESFCLAMTEGLRAEDPRILDGSLWGRDSIQRFLADRLVGLWVVKSRHFWQGLLLGRLGPGDAEILYLYVLPEDRGRGVAAALVRAFQQDVRSRIVLEVRLSNHAAKRLYEQCGFVLIGTRPRYYRDGEAAEVWSWSPKGGS